MPRVLIIFVAQTINENFYCGCHMIVRIPSSLRETAGKRKPERSQKLLCCELRVATQSDSLN